MSRRRWQDYDQYDDYDSSDDYPDSGGIGDFSDYDYYYGSHQHKEHEPLEHHRVRREQIVERDGGSLCQTPDAGFQTGAAFFDKAVNEKGDFRENGES